jgi:hypothetical protein
VLQAIRDGALGCIAVCYFKWARAGEQRPLIPWTVLRDGEDSERIAATLTRAPRPFEGSTDLGAAIRFAVDRLPGSIDCERRNANRRVSMPR